MITQNILKLNKTEQDQLFRLLVDNVDLLLKAIPSSSLLIYIKTGKPVDDNPIIQAYSAWSKEN